MGKAKTGGKYLGISEVVGASKEKHYQLNLGRFYDKKVKGGVPLNSAYLIVAKKLIEDYKKHNLRASDFVFKTDVFKILKYQKGQTK